MPRLKRPGASFTRLFAVAAIARLLILPSAPVLENDFLRYLWDGRVLAHGINPYRFAPNAPELDALAVAYRSHIGWSGIRTIYPPLAELLFAGLHLAWGDSLLALKIVLTALDLAVGVLLAGALARRGLPAALSAWWLLNPLVLKEVANSAHLDALPVLLSTAAVLAMASGRDDRRRLGAWALLGAATAAKLYPLVLLPLFFKVDPRRSRGLAAFAAVALALFVPFLLVGHPFVAGLDMYARYWRFNASAFAGLVWLLRSPAMAKICAGALFAGWLARETARLTNPSELSGAALSVLGALLILSPVVDAWYVLWILPFACLERSRPSLAFSALAGLAYLWFFDHGVAVAARLIEYGGLFGLLALERGRRARAAAGLSPATA